MFLMAGRTDIWHYQLAMWWKVAESEWGQIWPGVIDGHPHVICKRNKNVYQEKEKERKLLNSKVIDIA